jgi:hypothetical protein
MRFYGKQIAWQFGERAMAFRMMHGQVAHHFDYGLGGRASIRGCWKRWQLLGRYRAIDLEKQFYCCGVWMELAVQWSVAAQARQWLWCLPELVGVYRTRGVCCAELVRGWLRYSLSRQRWLC